MRFLNSQPSPPRTKRIGELKSRLQVLTQDYAPFFAGLPGRRSPSEIILTDLQQLRRAQLAFIVANPSGSEGEAEQ
jgi:hypothetical protein